jgi:hypothetical protein
MLNIICQACLQLTFRTMNSSSNGTSFPCKTRSKVEGEVVGSRPTICLCNFQLKNKNRKQNKKNNCNWHYLSVRNDTRVLTKFNIYYMQEAVENDKLLDQKHMMLEFASFSDGKEAVAKAANLLFVKSLTSKNSSGDQEDEIFTEPHMTEALRAVGLFFFAVVLNGFEN